MRKWLLCLALLLPTCTPSYSASVDVELCNSYSIIAKKLIDMKNVGITKHEVEDFVTPYKRIRGLQHTVNLAFATDMDSVSFSNHVFKDCMLKGGY